MMSAILSARALSESFFSRKSSATEHSKTFADTRQSVWGHVQAIGEFNLRHTQNFPSLNDRISKYFSESLYFTFRHVALLF